MTGVTRMARKTETDNGLSDEFKISARGTPETHDAINRLLGIAAVSRARETWGRRPGKAPIINAVLLYVDRLPREVKSTIVEEGVRMLKDLKENREAPAGEVDAGGFFARPVPIEAEARPASRGRGEDAKAPRRRKSS